MGPRSLQKSVNRVASGLGDNLLCRYIVERDELRRIQSHDPVSNGSKVIDHGDFWDPKRPLYRNAVQTPVQVGHLQWND